VATAALNAADIAAPLRSVLRRAANITVFLAEVERVDLAARRLVLEREEIGYDALILAAGAGHSYFGHQEWEVFAPGLKTLEDALEIRRRVLLAYEAAERERDGAEQRALLTFVGGGGGPTGVELAGALGEISRQTIARDFRLIDPTKARIVLLEGGARVLASFPESLSSRAEAALRRIGVEVIASSSSRISRFPAIPRPSPSAICASSRTRPARRYPAWRRSPSSRAAGRRTT
jgi:NADH:ubiquinone reductase (H+-translocating)